MCLLLGAHHRGKCASFAVNDPDCSVTEGVPTNLIECAGYPHLRLRVQNSLSARNLCEHFVGVFSEKRVSTPSAIARFSARHVV